jgi:hypothetical protein
MSLDHISTRAALAAEQASALFWQEQYRDTAAELERAQQRVAELEAQLSIGFSMIEGMTVEALGKESL